MVRTLELLVLFASLNAEAVLSTNPVLGVLAEPSYSAQQNLAAFGHSFISASYVKWLESAGGRVVPLPFDLPEVELQRRLVGLNGVLFPGGGATINDGGAYATFSRKVFDWARSPSVAVPVWGTCLGFEAMFVFTSSEPVGGGVSTVLSKVAAEALFLPLNFTSAVTDSVLLKDAPDSVMGSLGKMPITVNLHTLSVAPSVVANDRKLAAQWRVLATNEDRNGIAFVSLAEGVGGPAAMFASQFHPEKNAFEHHQDWDTDEVSAEIHSSGAIAAAAWLARRFVDEARRSTRAYASHSEFTNLSIWNYAPVYTDKLLPGLNLWDQAYVFPKSA